MSLMQRVQRKARREILNRTAGIRGAAKAAIIGCGQISPDHLSGYNESGVATVVAVSDVRAGAMASLLRHYPSDPRLSRLPDADQRDPSRRRLHLHVAAAPPRDRPRRGAARRQGHPVREADGAARCREVEEMIDVCRSAGVKLAIGHQYRFHPYFIHAAAMVARGALGKIVEVRGNIKDSVANNGPHLLDTIRFVLGDRPARRVTATFERTGDKDEPRLAGRGRRPRRNHVRGRRRRQGRAGRFLADLFRHRGRRRQVASLKINLDGV